MSTNDVPGAKASNNDALAAGCWAEHSEDNTLIRVDDVEGKRVIFSVFDTAKDPMIEYRTALPEKEFKENFSWKPNDPKSEKWIWHDKTAFPWDRLIGDGLTDGARYPSAGGLLSAASRPMTSMSKIFKEPVVETPVYPDRRVVVS